MGYESARDSHSREPLPPKPEGHESIEEAFADFMKSGFGPHWKYRLPAEMRAHLRTAFYGGFTARVTSMLHLLPEGMSQHAPDFMASLKWWLADIEAFAREMRTAAERFNKKPGNSNKNGG